MAEKEEVFSSRIKYKGIFTFNEFYEFCYRWLTEEIGLDVAETKYSEKLSGDSKEIEIKWEGSQEMTDYFRFDAKVSIDVNSLKKVEITKGDEKIESNSGSIELKISSSIIRDYKGKFETTAFNKFMRSIYEKWVITSRIDEIKGKISEESDEFLSQAKAWLDLEGKKNK